MIRVALCHVRRLLRDRRGVSALEFGIIAPVMFTMLLATFDLGQAAQQQIQLQEALRIGGQYVLSFPSDTTGIKSAISAAVPSGWSNVTVAAPSTSCKCWTSSSTSACAASGAPCSSGAVIERFVSLGVSATYTGAVISPTISASYVVRYQ